MVIVRVKMFWKELFSFISNREYFFRTENNNLKNKRKSIYIYSSLRAPSSEAPMRIKHRKEM